MFFYSFLTHLFLPIYILFASGLVLLGKLRLSSLLQRLSFRIPRNIPQNPIWMHAVSAGEVAAVSCLILYLQQQAIPVVLTTTTDSGFTMAKKRLGNLQTVIHSPFDLPFIVNRFYQKINPKMLIVVEMELWPELFRMAKKKGCPLLIINGRMPYNDYKLYNCFKKTMGRLFEGVSKAFVQSAEEGSRYVSLGLEKEKIEVLPNLKYYQYTPPQRVVKSKVDNIFSELIDKPVVVIGSSHPEEELFLIEVIEKSKILVAGHVIWAPRDISRSDKLVKKLQVHGFKAGKKSNGDFENKQVIILDSYGELTVAYEVANLVLLGGSWSRKVQGHNPLEATALGKPVVFGPCMNNFSSIASDLIIHQAAWQSADILETANLVSKIIRDSLGQKKMGQAGIELVKSKQFEVQKYKEFLMASYRKIKR